MGVRTLAEKLDALFRRNGGVSLEDAARAIRAGGGPTISASYLWLLRTGRKDNPTLRHVEALARYFGVPPAYFFDGLDDAEAEGIEADLEARTALRDPETRALATRAARLSEASRRALSRLAEHLEEVERPGGRRRPEQA
jgi:transcriptional regulator with XRE-family HTH domain